MSCRGLDGRLCYHSWGCSRGRGAVVIVGRGTDCFAGIAFLHVVLPCLTVGATGCSRHTNSSCMMTAHSMRSPLGHHPMITRSMPATPSPHCPDCALRHTNCTAIVDQCAGSSFSSSSLFVGRTGALPHPCHPQSKHGLVQTRRLRVLALLSNFFFGTIAFAVPIQQRIWVVALCGLHHQFWSDF